MLIFELPVLSHKYKPSNPANETNLRHFYSFGSYSELIDESWNLNWQVDQERHFQLFTTTVWYNLSANLGILLPLTCEQDPKILQLLPLGQWLAPNPH